ncbi:MAG: ClpXP protease specificity-enhancing factor [Gammaproteobacteria bacterium]
MNPRRPYLLRAMHEWIMDNRQTPHVVVDAGVDGVCVPPEFITDGKIVLNLSHDATSDLIISNDLLEFDARFGGRPFHVSVPGSAVMGIYARETGQGMIFGAEDGDPDPDPDSDPDKEETESARPHLRLVK